MGHGPANGSLIPVQVCVTWIGDACSEFLTNIDDIAAGFSHNLALDTAGGVWSWGQTGYGQLGRNATDGGRTAGRVYALGALSPQCSSYLTGIKKLPLAVVIPSPLTGATALLHGVSI